jgi:hypothetical protein
MLRFERWLLDDVLSDTSGARVTALELIMNAEFVLIIFPFLSFLNLFSDLGGTI